MYKVRHGTQQSCRCLKDEEQNCRWLALLPGIVPILHGGLLNHMTIITKVGVSYNDHMNDDAPEVDSFFCGCYQALSSPPFMRREPGDEANPNKAAINQMNTTKVQNPRHKLDDKCLCLSYVFGSQFLPVRSLHTCFQSSLTRFADLIVSN